MTGVQTCALPILKQLGALFPKPQDHSTVINTKYNWGNLMSSDEKFAADWLQLHILVESNLRRKIAQTPKQVTPCEDKKRKQIKLNLDKAKQIVERQLLQVSLKRAELLAKLEKFNDTPELKKKLYQIQIEKSLV